MASQKAGHLTRTELRRLGAIDWADVRPLIEQIGKKHQTFNALRFLTDEPALSEQDVIQPALYFASPKASIEQMAEAMLRFADARLISHGSRECDTTFAEKEPARGAVIGWWSAVSEVREAFRQAVLLVISNPQSARKKYGPRVARAFESEQIVRVPRWDSARMREELRVFSLSTQAACDYVLMLLLHEARLHRDFLRLCKEDECTRPFLAVPATRGSPLPDYCSEDCRLSARRALTAARVARLRVRNAARKAK